MDENGNSSVKKALKYFATYPEVLPLPKTFELENIFIALIDLLYFQRDANIVFSTYTWASYNHFSYLEF